MFSSVPTSTSSTGALTSPSIASSVSFSGTSGIFSTFGAIGAFYLEASSLGASSPGSSSDPSSGSRPPNKIGNSLIYRTCSGRTRSLRHRDNRLESASSPLMPTGRNEHATLLSTQPTDQSVPGASSDVQTAATLAAHLGIFSAYNILAWHRRIAKNPTFTCLVTARLQTLLAS